MTRLALLRHGHTAWNRAGRIQGRTDIPLDDDARASLAQLQLPNAWRDADLVASPLSRAIETGMIVAGRTPRSEPALLEMNWGDWEGAIAAKLHADPQHDHRPIDQWGWHYCPPGGEAPSDLRARLTPWANGLRRDTLAVCHIGVMRVLMAVAMGWDFDGPAPFTIKRGRLYIIDITPSGWSASGDPVRLEPRI